MRPCALLRTREGVDTHHLSGDGLNERKQLATLQAVAAMAGAELTQTKAGAFVVRRGDYSAHCQGMGDAAQAVHRMAGTNQATTLEATA